MNLLFALIPALLLAGTTAHAATVEIAAAANLGGAIKEIGAAFQKESGHQANITLGATGKLYAQILHGAPFDLLLAADTETPARLERAGLGVAGSRFTYAVGRLALWSPKPGEMNEGVLRGHRFRFLALANPKLAPYGVAAREVLQGMGLWEGLQDKLVLGENITQAQQFIQSGNADLGFVALAQVRAPSGALPGASWLVPATLHAPIRQDAVLLAPGREAGRAFLDFLRGQTARGVLAGYGYEEETGLGR